LTEQEKIVKLCEKLNNLLDKTILEGYNYLEQCKTKRLEREKLKGVNNELSN